jgi:hypothetical protein
MSSSHHATRCVSISHTFFSWGGDSLLPNYTVICLLCALTLPCRRRGHSIPHPTPSPPPPHGDGESPVLGEWLAKPRISGKQACTLYTCLHALIIFYRIFSKGSLPHPSPFSSYNPRLFLPLSHLFPAFFPCHKIDLFGCQYINLAAA